MSKIKKMAIRKVVTFCKYENCCATAKTTQYKKGHCIKSSTVLRLMSSHGRGQEYDLRFSLRLDLEGNMRTFSTQ